uniref:Ancillary SecYEG translocon subunit n=1 Tax=Candidatus Kentrum sp. FW TaxID=2126338 RepID=A0A450S5U3_9GAMM|nr:MAG: Putative negative regulator of RcsB-dependent stress response [Candidatus Kentron sp. FW]
MKIAYQSEQEQLESLQKWWKENGRTVIFGGLLGVAGIIGWSSWQAYTIRQAEKISFRYEQVMTLAGNNALDDTIRRGESLIDEYPGSGYGALTSLIVAKAALDQNDTEKAKDRLRWIIDEGGSPAVQSVARLRLARLLASEEKWQDATALLDGDAGEFLGLYEEVRGDILFAQGKIAEARAAFRRSLANSSHLADGRFRDRIKMKLDDLGSAPESEGAPDI